MIQVKSHLRKTSKGKTSRVKRHTRMRPYTVHIKKIKGIAIDVYAKNRTEAKKLALKKYMKKHKTGLIGAVSVRQKYWSYV